MLLIISTLMRTAHVLAGGVWVGGSVIYLSVIIPALRAAHADSLVAARIAALFRRVVNICIGALLISGVYLIFDRLASTTVGVAYVAVLAAKVALALAMILLAVFQAQEARRPARKRGRLWTYVPRWILGLGILTFVLGVTLTTIFESSLTR